MLPWTSLYHTSLELENYDEGMKEPILYALNFGPCGLKTHKDDNTEEVMYVHPIEVHCPGNIGRKEEKLTYLDYVIKDIQNKFYF